MIAFLKRLFGATGREDAVARCYDLIVEQSRRPEFYLAGGVPDTLDGRYEMLALHAFLVVHRLKRQGEPARLFSRDLFEGMITEMDRTVREMGVADMGVASRVKRMAKGFNGRIHAYDHGVAAGGDHGVAAGGDHGVAAGGEHGVAAGGDHGVAAGGGEALLAALDNNLYGTVLEPAPEALAAMAAYIRLAVAGLAALPLETLLAGEVRFPEPPGGGGGDSSRGAGGGIPGGGES